MGYERKLTGLVWIALNTESKAQCWLKGVDFEDDRDRQGAEKLVSAVGQWGSLDLGTPKELFRVKSLQVHAGKGRWAASAHTHSLWVGFCPLSFRAAPSVG